MREAEPDDVALMAYADHVEAVMAGDLGKYGEAFQRYNAADKDRFTKRNLPLFYPKPHGSIQ